MSKYAAVFPLFIVVGAGILAAGAHGTRILATHNDVQLNKRVQHPFSVNPGVRLVSRDTSKAYIEKNFHYMK